MKTENTLYLVTYSVKSLYLKTGREFILVGKNGIPFAKTNNDETRAKKRKFF